MLERNLKPLDVEIQRLVRERQNAESREEREILGERVWQKLKLIVAAAYVVPQVRKWAFLDSTQSRRQLYDDGLAVAQAHVHRVLEKYEENKGMLFRNYALSPLLASAVLRVLFPKLRRYRRKVLQAIRLQEQARELEEKAATNGFEGLHQATRALALRDEATRKMAKAREIAGIRPRRREIMKDAIVAAISLRRSRRDWYGDILPPRADIVSVLGGKSNEMGGNRGIVEAGA